MRPYFWDLFSLYSVNKVEEMVEEGVLGYCIVFTVKYRRNTLK